MAWFLFLFLLLVERAIHFIDRILYCYTNRIWTTQDDDETSYNTKKNTTFKHHAVLLLIRIGI